MFYFGVLFSYPVAPWSDPTVAMLTVNSTAHTKTVTISVGSLHAATASKYTIALDLIVLF